MGGAGVALLSGPEYQAINPASILGVRRPELQAEFKIFSGGAGVKSVPTELLLENDQTLLANNYRVRPKEVLDYHSLSFGLPITLLGKRGALGLTYRRMSSAGAQDETRAELRGPVTNQAEATYGLGDLPEDGMDAVSFTAAREITDFLDLGVNLNWMSGTLIRDTNIGVSVFGFQFLDGYTVFSQDVSSFNVDVGGRLEYGPIQAGGAVYVNYDMDFTSGAYRQKPLPDPQDPSQEFLVLAQSHDHTMSVPLMYSLGLAVEPTDGLTVVADFWARPWKKSGVTRVNIESEVGFRDPPGDPDVPGDPDSYYFELHPSQPDSAGNVKSESFNAGLDNTHSLRFGVEYLFVNTESFDLPVRFGFRRENLTMNNVMIPDFKGLPDSLGVPQSTDYEGLIDDYYVALDAGDPDVVEYIEEQLKAIAEGNHQNFRGTTVASSVFTFGIGVRWNSFGADLAFERVSYDLDRFFLNDFDPLFWTFPEVAQENRSLTNVSFSMRMRF